jgi:hypothetical protein
VIKEHDVIRGHNSPNKASLMNILKVADLDKGKWHYGGAFIKRVMKDNESRVQPMI